MKVGETNNSSRILISTCQTSLDKNCKFTQFLWCLKLINEIKFHLNALRNFQTFESNANPQSAPTYANVPPQAPVGYGGPFLNPSAPIASNMYDQPDAKQKSYGGDSQFDDEPPLLEGISNHFKCSKLFKIRS